MRTRVVDAAPRRGFYQDAPQAQALGGRQLQPALGDKQPIRRQVTPELAKGFDRVPVILAQGVGASRYRSEAVGDWYHHQIKAAVLPAQVAARLVHHDGDSGVVVQTRSPPGHGASHGRVAVDHGHRSGTAAQCRQHGQPPFGFDDEHIGMGA